MTDYIYDYKNDKLVAVVAKTDTPIITGGGHNCGKSMTNNKLLNMADVVKPDALSCENKRIDEMTLDDYRRGFNKLFNGMRLR